MLENHNWRQHFFFTSALRKNSCIGKKCLNDVQNNKNTNTNFRWGEFPPAISVEETRLYNADSTLCIDVSCAVMSHGFVQRIDLTWSWSAWKSSSSTIIQDSSKFYIDLRHKYNHCHLSHVTCVVTITDIAQVVGWRLLHSRTSNFWPFQLGGEIDSVTHMVTGCGYGIRS